MKSWVRLIPKEKLITHIDKCPHCGVEVNKNINIGYCIECQKCHMDIKIEEINEWFLNEE